ncbi:MAG: FAD-binding oxidoreductase [Candidatus Woesearchaeota archaeon]
MGVCLEGDDTENIDVGEDFFEIIMAQRDCAPAMKPKSFSMGMIADSIVKPKNANQIKSLLRSHKCVIRGSGSTFTGSILPHEGETIISTANLDSVTIKGRKAEVGGGTPFYRLMRAAKRQNLEVPSYPHTYNTATVGGFISNNGIVGFNSIGTGYLFDYIDELDVISASGTRYKVRGEDIKDFFGAEGRLGLILKVKMRLIERQTRYVHIYGFDGIEDLLRFKDENDDIYACYVMTKNAMKVFEKELQLKHISEYSAIIIDKNWKDDYKKKLRTDLAQDGVSYIYPKDVVKYCFKRVGRMELGLVGRRDNVHIGDGIVSYDDCYKIIRAAKSEGMPLFMNFGKNEILYRVYGDCKSTFRRLKFMSLMDSLHSVSEPNSVGSFFASGLEGTPRAERTEAAKGKYDTKFNILQRVQLYPNKRLRTFLSPFIRTLGGVLWKDE